MHLLEYKGQCLTPNFLLGEQLTQEQRATSAVQRSRTEHIVKTLVQPCVKVQHSAHFISEWKDFKQALEDLLN